MKRKIANPNKTMDCILSKSINVYEIKLIFCFVCPERNLHQYSHLFDGYQLILRF